MDDATLARFLAKVRILPSGCWQWLGKANDNNYGYFWLDGKSQLAHRVSYRHFVGPIPDGFEIDHKCHTNDRTCPGGVTDAHRMCVCPDDLEAVPGYTNIMRSRGAAPTNLSKTHCSQGHEFTADNTYVYPDGAERACRICRAQAIRDWRHAKNPDAKLPASQRTHCPQGHPYDEINTRVNRAGKRICIACYRQQDRESKARKRAEARAATQQPG